MQRTEKISGTVHKILFQDVTTGFTILVLQPERQKSLVATGTFPLIIIGQELHAEGSWEQHPRFGPQFAISAYYSATPSSCEGLKRYLGSGFIKGVGEVFADKLVETFGKEVLRVIDESPHMLTQISGVGEKRIQAIVSSWKEHKDLSHIMLFLQEKGLSPLVATKIYKYYRERTIKVLQEQPYQLIDDIWGIGFSIADTIAQKMGLSPIAPERLSAAISYYLRAEAKQGNLYVSYEKLYKSLPLLLGFQDHAHLDEIHAEITSLIARRVICIIEEHDQQLIALTQSYEAEVYVADKLQKLLNAQSSYHHALSQVSSDHVKKMYHSQIVMSEEQNAALLSALRHKVVIITGGPGTGKTTLIKVLLHVLDQHGIKYKLAAPTGRAAKRMTESTQRGATTLHRLLEFDPSTATFRHQEEMPLKIDVLIIDEVSMLDIFLAQSMLKALHPATHLILLGDIDQLPPVGPGNFLSDCISSDTIPTTRLTQIFRQAEGSGIAYNAQRIREGLFPTSHAIRDFSLISETDPDQFTRHLEQLIATERLTPLQLMVLCPMNRGTAGTQRINHFLQSLFNADKKPSFFCGGTQFKVDDRVMQLRNNYEKVVFNGDIGIITLIDQASGTFTIGFDGRIVMYSFDEATEIALAYAMTVHKSQGSEFPVVIIPVFMQHFMMLRRNLLYTAVTRATTRCIVVGEKKAFAIALRQIDTQARITLLRKLLRCVIKPCVF
jgi:exodeoxyribonuclease V alpha subunit